MERIEQTLARFSGRTACLEGGRRWTYEAFVRMIGDAEAAVDAAGLPDYAVIAVQTEQTVAGLAALLAIADRKQIALPLPAELSGPEQAAQRRVAAAPHTLRTSGDRFVLETGDGAAPSPAHPLVAELAQSGHAGLVLFSSGTSGEPKAMLHDLPALLARFEDIRPRDERSLLLLLIDHIGGLDSAFRTLFAGSTLVIPEARTPEAAGAAIAAHGVTVLPASPTFLNLMLLGDVPGNYDCDSVRIIAYGAEPMPQALLENLAAAFPRASLRQTFGTSETGAIRIQSSSNESLFFRITDRDTEWKVVDDELWLKTPSRILGYLNAEAGSLEADGWYRTGDLVEEGPDQTLHIIGRRSDMINVGGRKAHPAEIEDVIATLPGIEACEVFARPDPITGNTVACRLFTREPADPLTWKRRIRQHCRGKLAPWKVPASVSLASKTEMTRRLKRVRGNF